LLEFVDVFMERTRALAEARSRKGMTVKERIAFSSAILPPYARRSKSLEVSIPIL
jgi:hypothetical protein